MSFEARAVWLRAWAQAARSRPCDAVVRITTTTICGTDLHILKGDVPTVTAAEFLGTKAILSAGGRLANIGVHGEPVQLHLEKLWDRNIGFTTRLVDTAAIPMLLKLVQSGSCNRRSWSPPVRARRHHERLRPTFGSAAKERALKAILASPARQ